MDLAEELQITEDRIACQFCNRKFVPKSLSKHAFVCEKTLHKKRKTFDSAKQRIQGTELAEFTPPKINETPIIISAKKKPLAEEKPKPRLPNVPSRKFFTKTASLSIKSCNYEKCEYCDRTFGPKAFDRHVEWCKEQNSRINSTSLAVQEAKERLEARIKYRAPSFRGKRGVTSSNCSPTPISCGSPSLSIKSEYLIREGTQESEKKFKVQEKVKPVKETNFIRQNVLRFSYKPRPAKKQTNKQPNDCLPGVNRDYQNLQDWISANGTKVHQHPRTPRSVTACSSLTSSLYYNYDPFELAEEQLQHLLNDKSDEIISSKEGKRSKFNNKENISGTAGPVKTISCQTDNSLKEDKSFKASPTSAFEKYPVNVNDDGSINRVPTPALNSDFDSEQNFAPANKLTKGKDTQSSNEMYNMNRYPLISLSNLSLCSSVSLDVAEENRKLSVGKDGGAREDLENPLKRNVSVVDKGNKNNVRKNLRMENLLYGNENRDNPEDDSYRELEADDINLRDSFDEFESMFQNSYYEDDRCTTGSESPPRKQNSKRERGDSLASKTSVDSAYNSLSRKSPSIVSPETNVMKTSTTSLSPDFAQNEQKLSKFCHECGVKFPLSIAKFCCECGVRRLVI